MRKTGNSVIGTLLIMGVCLMILQACSGSSDDDSIKPRAVKPYITVHPTSTDYVTGDTIAALKVSAAFKGDGNLSYQWFEADRFVNSGGTEISGETETTFLPNITGGTKFYYVEVSSEDSKTLVTTSNPARIRILTEAAEIPASSIDVTDNSAQYVRGFGGMSNSFGIGPAGVAKYMEMRDIDTMFDQEHGLGMNIFRICLYHYPLDEVIKGERYSEIDTNRLYYEFVKRVNSYGGYVLASPWTAPAYFKTNDSLMAGGHLKRDLYAEYANYLSDFCKNMADNGAPIYAISIQNEPSLVVSYEGMEWTDIEHRDFMRDYGTFTQGAPSIKAWGGGSQQTHVRVMMGEPHQPQPNPWYSTAMDTILNDAAAIANADIAAYHIYGGLGDRNVISRNRRLTDLGIETWMTEWYKHSGNENLYYQDSTWNFVWDFLDSVHHVIANNDSNAYVAWYLKRFYSFIGDDSYGTVNGTILPRGYAFSHYAKYASDTVRISAALQGHPSSGNVRLSAYQRKTSKVTENEKKVMADEDSISIVLYDKRTGAAASSEIKVNLPEGYIASSVFGIISDETQKQAPVLVVLAKDGKSAVVTLPVNAIISVKFVK